MKQHLTMVAGNDSYHLLHRCRRLLWVFLLCVLVPHTVQAQLLKPFTQRTSTYSPEKKIYRIKGDYTIIGNTNCRKIGIPDYDDGIYDATQYNQNVRYVDVDTFSSTMNSSTAELKLSQEDGANPECSNIVFAGLYWTGRTDDSGMVYHNHFENSVEVKNNGIIAGHKLTIVLSQNSNNIITRRYTFTPLSEADGDTIRVYLSLNKNTGYHYVYYEDDTLLTTRSRTTELPGESCIQLNDSLWITGLFRGYKSAGTINWTNSSIVQGQYTSGSAAMISKKPFKSYRKNEIKLRHASAPDYTLITANPENIHYDKDPYHDYAFAAYAEVTDYVRQYGEGNYTVADLASAIGDDQQTGYFGGWGMVVVYENDLMQWQDITIFDGFADIRDSNRVHIPISGFRTVQVGDVNVKLGYIVAEGDTRNSGEQLKILRNDNNEWFDLSHDTDPLWHPLDLVHPTDSNFFQSIISGDNYKNPENEYCGLDIATFMMENPNNALITNHQTQTEFYFTTFKDVFLPICFVMGVDAYVPDAEAISGVMNLGTNVEYDDELGYYTIEPGDTVDFIVDVKNLGTEDILDAKLEIPLPKTIEYHNTEVLYVDEGVTADHYFDAERNANGTVGWDINYLEAGDPNKTLVRVKLTCKVTKDCFVLAATDDDSCLLALHVNGTLEGTSYVNNIYFKKESFISGFVDEGPCSNSAIRNDIVVVVDKKSYNEINCDDQDYTHQVINVCEYSYSATEPVPFMEIYQLYPPGSRFFNTVTGEEYTVETGFPMDVIGTTIEVRPSATLPASCSSELKLVSDTTGDNFDEDPPVLTNTSITYCLGAEAMPLSSHITLADTTYYARFYEDTTGGVSAIAEVDIIPSTAQVGTYRYYIRQFKENSIGCEDDLLYGPIVVTVVSPIEFTSDRESPSCFGEEINLTAMPAGGTFSFPAELAAHIDTVGNVLTIKETMPAGEITVTYTHTGITDPNNCEITYLTYTHKIAEPTIPGILSADQNICEGSLIQPLLVEGANGHVERWEWTTDTIAGPWNVIPNNTTSISSADLGLLANGKYFYRALVKDGNCAPKWTNIVTVEVTDGTAPAAPVITHPQYACYDTDYEIQIADPVDGAYAWYDQAVGGWPHDSLRTVHVTDAWVSRWVGFVDSLSGCASNRTLVSVRSNLDPGKIATTGQIACTRFEDPFEIGPLVIGTDTVHAKLLNGTVGTIEYRWYVQKDGGDTVRIEGATGAKYTPSADMMATEGVYIFTRYAKVSGCTHWQKSTGSWKLVVGPPDASIVVHPEHSILCEGSSIGLTLAASGPGTKYAYQWYKDGVAIPNAIQQTYYASEVGVYYADVTHRASGCSTRTPEGKVVEIIKDENPPIAENAVTTIQGCGIDDAHNTATYTTVATIEAALAIEISDQISGGKFTPDSLLTLSLVDSVEIENPEEFCYQLVRTYKVEDVCGGSTTFTHTINVDDTIAPKLKLGEEFPMGTTNNDVCLSAAPAGPTAEEIAALYEDNCGTLTVLKDETIVGDDCDWSIAYTYVIKDACNNATTATVSYSGGDQTAPALKSGSALPADGSNMSLCYDSIPAGPTVEEIAALYEDNCGGEVIVSKSGTPTGNDCGWNVTYTYDITDVCGNATTATVSYSGKAADFVMPANGTKTVQCIDDATAPTLPEIKDACGTVLEPKTSSMVDSPSPLICEGTRTYTYTYEDCAGHTHDWTYTYTIDRTTAPSEVDGPVATSSTVECVADATAPTTLPVVEDVCGNVIPAPTPVEGGTYTDCEGTKTYTYTYKDCANLEYVWTYTYTIERTTAPSEVDGPVATSSTVGCIADATAPATLPVVKDVCGNTLAAPEAVVTDNPSSLTCEGTRTYTYTYKDCSGLQFVWTYTYTIDRTTAPAEVGGPVATASTVECVADATAPTALPVVKDVCGNVIPAPTPVVGGTYTDCEGTRTYTYTYKDCSGLQFVWTYTYTIDRTTAPSEVGGPVAASSTVECASAATAPTTLPVVKDVCGNVIPAPTPVEGGTYTDCEGTKTYTYTYKDCANLEYVWTYTYTIERTTAPAEVGGPVATSSTVECVADATAPATLPVVEDVCGNVIPAPTPVEGGTYTDCEGTKTYTYTYKDCANLEYVWTYTYTIDRTTAPSEVGGPVATASTVECASAATAPTTLPVVKDVCGNTLAAPTPVVGGTYTDCEGTKTYTYTYKDCANLEYVWTYTYTIDRTTAPAQEGGPVATSSTVECVADATAPATLPVVKDVCGNVIPAPTPVVGGTYTDCEGTKTYTYTYEDCAGLQYVWTYTYTIDRMTAPAEVGGPVATASTVECVADATEPTALPVVEDVCGNVIPAPTPVEGGTYTDCEGTKTYTYTYKDCANLEYVWTYTYTIDRTTAPAQEGGPVATSSTVECASAATAPTTLPVVKDVCGNTLAAPTPVVGGTYTDCEGTKTYTYTYKDCANLEYVWTYTYTIDRTTAPNEVGGPVATASTVECVADATAPTTLPVVKDVCGNTLAAPTPVVGGTYTDCEGTKTYTYTYKDCANLEYVWTYTYTIDRTTAPNEVGGPVATASTVECVADATAPTTLPVVKDVCGNVIPAPTPVEGGTYTDCEGTKIYTYTYKDCSGLQFVWTYTYTIDRTTAPAEVGGPVTTASTVECASAATAPTTLPVVKDVCGNVIPAPTPVEGGTYTDCEGTKTYTYTYKDCANLEYVWTYTYTIDRTTAPSEVGGPVTTASTVECASAATAPTALPVVKDVCGNVIPAPTPVEGGTYTDCEGTKTYTYTYEDCAGLQFVWTYTYTIERTTAPAEVGGPVTTASTVECASAATAPTALPVVKDVCGNVIPAPTPVEGGTYTDCEGTKTYTYTYKDCANLKYVWTYTYTIEHPTLTFTGSITDVENVDACYSESHKSELLTAEQVKAMYTSSCSREITVSASDVVVRSSDCDWKITRTYSISDGGCNTDSQTMSISGGDQSAPTIGTDNLDRTLTSTNCVFTIPDLTAEVRAISSDNCTDNASLVVTQSSAGVQVYPMATARDTIVSVTVTDACGKTSTKSVTITIPAKLTISASATPAVICNGETAQLNSTVANIVGTAVYVWTPATGLSSTTIANPTATLTASGASATTTYTVQVTDDNGCAATATTSVTVNPEVVMNTVADWTLCVGETSPAYVYTSTITDGTVTYGWSNDNTAIGLAASGTGNLPSFVATNTTSADLIAEVKVAPTYTNNGISCQGDSLNFHITVRPSIMTPGNVEFTCPRDTTIELAYSECEQFVNIGYPEFVNNMTGMSVTITNDAPMDFIFSEGTTVVTWTATDECGAALTCTQNVVVQFPPCGTPADSVADFDGYRYSSVRIGCQCWTGENARSEHYSDGTPVDNFRYYNDSDSLENIYGKLYTWYTAARVPEGDNTAVPADSIDPLGRPYVQGICPEGWALPTVDEYMLMIANSGGATHAKDGSSLHWLPGFEGQPPFSGFDAYGAGMYNGALNRYEGLLGKTYFWTTLNVPGSETATTVEINYYCGEGLHTELGKGDGVSIRCLRKK